MRRRAAAKLGLGLTEKIRGGSSRRSSSLAAAAADVWKKIGTQSGSESEMELQLKKEKSLYLCFVEKSRCGSETYFSQVVRPIGLNSDGDDDDDEKYLRKAAYNKPSKVNTTWSFCCRLGSQIVFPTGTDPFITHFSLIDTSAKIIKFQKTKLINSFSCPKCLPLLWGLNGKLYCIDACANLVVRPFEVLDPEKNEWRLLDAPPFMRRSYYTVFTASVLEGSNKILGWRPEVTGVYYFDTTTPEIGWRESSFSLAKTLPFLDHYRRPPIFIRDHHPILGAFHLMFMYDHINLLVTPFFMSEYCDSFHIINNTPFQLPKLCNEYAELDCDDLSYDYYPKNPYPSTDFEFVPLGAQNVCLVLNKFFPHDHDLQDHDQLRNTGILLLITFEYEIITTIIHSKPTIEIQIRLLRTRRFRYRSKKLRKPDCTKTDEVRMSGVFLI